MSDKRPHIKPEELAGLIRQYLAGELDDKAMHDLERQALDDPFLADALDGYAQHSPDQQAQQADLTARLAQRIAPEKGKVRALYYRWAAAAAILLLMFSAGWFLWNQQKVAPPIAGIPAAPAPAADSAIPSPAPSTDKLANADKIAPETSRASQVLSKNRENMPAELSSTHDEVQEAAPAITPPSPTVAAAPAPVAAPALKSASPATLAPGATPAKPTGRSEGDQGFISDLYKKKQQTDTSLLGNVTLLNNKDKALHEVVVMGYGTQKKESSSANVMIRGVSPDSGLQRALQGKVAGVAIGQESNALNDVVVVGYGRNEDAEDPGYRAPSPVIGLTAFENYLRTKTVNPENKYNGVVRVAFTVMPDGSLQHFRILRHLNEACDAEAIRVIKEGPSWTPASDGKPAKVKVKVKFSEKKN
ncbi:TonB-like protein [Chitinophaga polysaccharea]|uniref:TonB-like protein n=1 Tax=Chitinophaga polysaccharea TaxID=1293035 RepID=A0A561Q289_9BACT|nr:energy transducer TonB [Chitinophaga polysaccharea]TWF44481.1 TonB-like protein [Chitinophaga polysaccharea]